MITLTQIQGLADYASAQLEEVSELRMLGRHFRDTSQTQLQHAAYRSARQRVRDLRTGKRGVSIVRCMCGKCSSCLH